MPTVLNIADVSAELLQSFGGRLLAGEDGQDPDDVVVIFGEVVAQEFLGGLVGDLTVIV